ncbi:hypothetical protein [Coleofasciculus sp. E1-EBD-02]|uniref:hypothetical protein n=1 Tax=Coleofasciculus sp. E1-EBD-02 TaxID=3068481 RepID=UPI00330116D5
MSVGNVVSAGLRLYRDHLKVYLGVAFRATLWSLIPFLGFIIIVVGTVFIAQPDSTSASPADFSALGWILLLTLIIGFPLSIYCIAKSLVNSAIIPRLAFGEIIYNPELIRQIRKILNSKFWQFLFLQILLFFILVGVNIGLSILQFLLFNLPAIMLENLLNNSLISGIWLIIGNIASLIAYLWFLARIFIPEATLAIENDINCIEAISRSWELTKGFAWRIQGIIVLAFLITLPIYIIAILPLMFTIIYFRPLFQNSPDEVFGIISVTFLFTGIIFLLANIVVLPLWQSVKGVIYYDLRSRREGLGMQLRDE